MSHGVVGTIDSCSPVGRLPGLFSTGQVGLSLRIHRLPAPFALAESRLSRLWTRAMPYPILLICTLTSSLNSVSSTCDVYLGCLWWLLLWWILTLICVVLYTGVWLFLETRFSKMELPALNVHAFWTLRGTDKLPPQKGDISSYSHQQFPYLIG